MSDLVQDKVAHFFVVFGSTIVCSISQNFFNFLLKLIYLVYSESKRVKHGDEKRELTSTNMYQIIGNVWLFKASWIRAAKPEHQNQLLQ